jgi:hypothetical protein
VRWSGRNDVQSVTTDRAEELLTYRFSTPLPAARVRNLPIKILLSPLPLAAVDFADYMANWPPSSRDVLHRPPDTTLRLRQWLTSATKLADGWAPHLTRKAIHADSLTRNDHNPVRGLVDKDGEDA